MRDTAQQCTARMNRMATDWSKWEATRRKGLLRFVLLAGVLGWGVSVAVLWSLLMSALMHAGSFLGWFGRAIILFPIGGVFWALAVWYLTERKYAREKKAAEPQA